jgi:hypothetical protein
LRAWNRDGFAAYIARALQYAFEMNGRQIAIIAYKPKPGKEADLVQLTREHVAILRQEGLATERPVIACQAADGTVVEVFEWEADALDRAHTNPRVLALWERYPAACDYIPLNTLPEAAQMFAGFKPLDL